MIGRCITDLNCGAALETGGAGHCAPSVRVSALMLGLLIFSIGVMPAAVKAQPMLNPLAGAIGAVAATPDIGTDANRSGLERKQGNTSDDVLDSALPAETLGLKAATRRCRLDKPLFGASPARLKCYALAAYRPTQRKPLGDSAMLGDPAMDHDEDILEELDVPDGVRDSEEAVEVMRAWVADGALHVIFDPETFRHDVSEWGRLLGDVAQHISNAVELDGQMSRHEALSQIHDAIEMSVSANSVTMDGKIKGRTEH